MIQRPSRWQPSRASDANADGDRRWLPSIWLRWEGLTRAEKVTCLAIVLVPVWWLYGWRHLTTLLAIALIGLDWQQYGRLPWRRPSLPVISALVFGCYILVNRFFHNQLTGGSFSPNSVLTVLNNWIGFAIILWYVQSHRIRVRLQVVAWSCSVLAVSMLLFWAAIYFGLNEAPFQPPRSLYGFLTGKSSIYVPGAGNSNYLLSYFHNDESLIPGMVRYILFLPGPEALALTAGCISCVALDLKNRMLSLSLFAAAVFIIMLSGTRSVLVALPIALLLRYLYVTGRSWGPGLICGLIASFSFVVLVFPDVTHNVSDLFFNTATATSELRGDSTEVRLEIYRRTWDEISNASGLRMLFGYVVTGETVLRGYAPATVGSHSFFLGTLLYRAGVVGTTIFATFWISLLTWLYRTRHTRPVCVLPIVVMFSFTFVVMEIEMPVMPFLLVSVLMLDTAEIDGRRSLNHKLNWRDLGQLNATDSLYSHPREKQVRGSLIPSSDHRSNSQSDTNITYPAESP